MTLTFFYTGFLFLHNFFLQKCEKVDSPISSSPSCWLVLTAIPPAFSKASIGSLVMTSKILLDLANMVSNENSMMGWTKSKIHSSFDQLDQELSEKKIQMGFDQKSCWLLESSFNSILLGSQHNTLGS